MKLLSVDTANYKDAPTEGIRRVLEEVTGSLDACALLDDVDRNPSDLNEHILARAKHAFVCTDFEVKLLCRQRGWGRSPRTIEAAAVT